MTTPAREPDGGPPSLFVRRVALIALLATLALYPCAYVFVRATHRLVHYGGYIAPANRLLPRSDPRYFRDDENLFTGAFAPCIWLEGTLRGF